MEDFKHAPLAGGLGAVRRHGFDSEYPEQFSTVDMWSTMGVLIVCTQCRHISTRMTTDSSHPGNWTHPGYYVRPVGVL